MNAKKLDPAISLEDLPVGQENIAILPLKDLRQQLAIQSADPKPAFQYRT
jgi:hypothetical protein